jgi:hypothetical protein
MPESNHEFAGDQRLNIWDYLATSQYLERLFSAKCGDRMIMYCGGERILEDKIVTTF